MVKRLLAFSASASPSDSVSVMVEDLVSLSASPSDSGSVMVNAASDSIVSASPSVSGSVMVNAASDSIVSASPKVSGSVIENALLVAAVSVSPSDSDSEMVNATSISITSASPNDSVGAGSSNSAADRTKTDDHANSAALAVVTRVSKMDPAVVAVVFMVSTVILPAPPPVVQLSITSCPDCVVIEGLKEDANSET